MNLIFLLYIFDVLTKLTTMKAQNPNVASAQKEASKHNNIEIYQNKVTSQTTMSPSQFMTGIQLHFP